MDRTFLIAAWVAGALAFPAGVRAASLHAIPPLKTAARVQPALAQAKAPVAEHPPAPTPTYQLYSYYGDRYRDPFIALNGDYRGDQGADRPPQISSLML